MDFLKKILIVIIGFFVFKYVDTHLFNEVNAALEINNSTKKEANELAISRSVIPTFEFAVEQSIDAVVHIKSKYVTDEYYQYLHPFYGRGYYTMPKEEIASGSGVIISEDGYIVTNSHVINNAKEIEVVLNNKQKFQAEILGEDASTDLALIKIKNEGLEFVEFANSDDAKIGQWVLAVGNPFNLNSTVTAGIISAKGRDIGLINQRGIESFIQTDAAINSGNSGGALVNIEGKLIGINTAIQSPSGVNTGYGFAIPSNMVEKIVADLKEFGKVQRAFLGINILEINSEIAKEFDLSSLEGVYIYNTINDGAAHRCGIRQGDVLTKIQDKEVNSLSDIQEQLTQYSPGDEIICTINRGGEILTFEVVL